MNGESSFWQALGSGCRWNERRGRGFHLLVAATTSQWRSQVCHLRLKICWVLDRYYEENNAIMHQKIFPYPLSDYGHIDFQKNMNSSASSYFFLVPSSPLSRDPIVVCRRHLSSSFCHLSSCLFAMSCFSLSSVFSLFSSNRQLIQRDDRFRPSPSPEGKDKASSWRSCM